MDEFESESLEISKVVFECKCVARGMSAKEVQNHCSSNSDSETSSLKSDCTLKVFYEVSSWSFDEEISAAIILALIQSGFAKSDIDEKQSKQQSTPQCTMWKIQDFDVTKTF